MKRLPTDAGRVCRIACGGRGATIALALWLAFAGAVSAQEPAGEATDAASAREAATFLLVPLGARNVGLGGAVAGADGDVEGAVWNPAALARVSSWAAHYHGANDFGTSTHALGGVARWGETRFGLSLLAVDLGSIEARDESNQPLGTIEPSNTLLIVTIARPVSSVFDVGASYKFVRLGGSCRSCPGLAPDATGHAFDLAVGARPTGFERLRLGLVVSNLGGGVAYESGGPTDPLPTRIRLGGELEVLAEAEGEIGLRLRADARQTFAEFDDFDVYAGAEAGYGSIAYVRAGYAASGEGRSGASLGVGLRFAGLHLDVARSFDDFAGFDSDAPFQVSVAYQP